MPQDTTDRFGFSNKRNNPHFSTAPWADQRIDLIDPGKQHGPDRRKKAADPLLSTACGLSALTTLSPVTGHPALFVTCSRSGALGANTPW
ncbi:MAG: hypothetical protein ABW148_18550 [Sedimenticola sp.]